MGIIQFTIFERLVTTKRVLYAPITRQPTDKVAHEREFCEGLEADRFREIIYEREAGLAGLAVNQHGGGAANSLPALPYQKSAGAKLLHSWPYTQN